MAASISSGTDGRRQPAEGVRSTLPVEPAGATLARPLENCSAGASALFRLLTWMSPAYPVGAYAYSGGIEWATAAGDIADAVSLAGWLTSLLRHGTLFGDAVMFAQAHRAAAAGDAAALAEISELAAALAGSKERFLETTSQGHAFIDITQAAWPTVAFAKLAACWDGGNRGNRGCPIAYPVAAGAACGAHGIAASPALLAFLHGAASNLVSAGVRLIPLGQTDGQRVLAALEAPIIQTAERALTVAPDEWGTATLRAEVAAMRHETQYTRLFRS